MHFLCLLLLNIILSSILSYSNEHMWILVHELNCARRGGLQFVGSSDMTPEMMLGTFVHSTCYMFTVHANMASAVPGTTVPRFSH